VKLVNSLRSVDWLRQLCAWRWSAVCTRWQAFTV
jgi:hypothetical protein